MFSEDVQFCDLPGQELSWLQHFKHQTHNAALSALSLLMCVEQEGFVYVVFM